MYNGLYKAIAKDVAKNYESIVGIPIKDIEFHINMDDTFYDESLAYIQQWVYKKYPGIDILSIKNKEFLPIMDQYLYMELTEYQV